jgi:hypothetical protein
MTKQNQKSISPFLVNKQTEGAEKALIKVTTVLSLEKLHSFSPLV